MMLSDNHSPDSINTLLRLSRCEDRLFDFIRGVNIVWELIWPRRNSRAKSGELSIGEYVISSYTMLHGIVLDYGS